MSTEEFDAVLPDFRHTAVPPLLTELLADPLLNPVTRSCISCPGQPVLPDDLPPSPVTYNRYAPLTLQTIAARKSAVLRDQLDLTTLDDELNTVPDDHLDAYSQYFCFFSPELFSNLDEDEQTLFYQHWTDRDFSSLY